MADFSKLQAAIDDLTAKQAAAFADLKSEIAKPPVEDPTIQQGIDAATASISALATDATAADPGAPTT